MAKNDLIGGALFDQYSNIVNERMDNPKHRGEITEEAAEAVGARLIVADFGAESCGDAVRLYWAVDPQSDVIKDAKFKSFGCGTAIASSDMMTELTLGKTVDQAIKITNLDVEKALRDHPDEPAVPPQKMHCSVMAYDVIKKAAALYKGIDIKTIEEAEMVCECARVTLSTIKEVIKLNDLQTVEQITDYTKAGAFCKSCIKPGGHEAREWYLEDILKETRAEMDHEKLTVAADSGLGGDFKKMTVVQQLKVIEGILDENIRGMLAMDGGNMEVLDIRQNDENIDVYIRYMGACVGCSSSSTGTLYAIEATLRDKVDPAIRVLPI